MSGYFWLPLATISDPKGVQAARRRTGNPSARGEQAPRGLEAAALVLGLSSGQQKPNGTWEAWAVRFDGDNRLEEGMPLRVNPSLPGSASQRGYRLPTCGPRAVRT